MLIYKELKKLVKKEKKRAKRNNEEFEETQLSLLLKQWKKEKTAYASSRKNSAKAMHTDETQQLLNESPVRDVQD